LARSSNRVLYVVSLNHAVNDGSVYLLSSLFPIVLAIFQLSVFQVGLLVAVGYLVSVVCQPIVGHYSEGRNPGQLLASGILVVSLSIVSFVFATGFISLLISVIVLRVGSSFFHPIGISAVSKTYSGPRLQKAMGFQSSFGNLGVLLVFLSAAPLYLALGWRSTFLVFAALTIADVMITLLALRRSPAGESGGRDSASSNTLRPGTSTLPVFFVTVAFISGGSYAVILNFANILLGTRTGLGAFESNLVVSGFIAAASLGAISTGVWARFSRTGVNLSISYLSASAALAIFTVFSSNVLVGIVALLATGFMISATYPLTYTELSNHVGNSGNAAGRSFGVLSSSQTIGASVMGFASGYFSQFLGLDFSFSVVSALMLLGFLSSTVWVRRGPKGL
jgi:MFS family permease